ncbi:MAG: threonine-phosphate decarboxylase CobD [Nitrospirota bacterium]
MRMIMQTHGGDIYQATRVFGILKDEIIDFSANINPLGPSKVAIREIKKHLYGIKDYPEPDSYNLREALGNYHNISPENIIAGNGSIEFIYLIPHALNYPKVFILSPTFSEYERACRISQKEVYHIVRKKEDGFNIVIDNITERLKDESNSLLFICNPNNPTGRAILKRDMLNLIDRLSGKDIFIVIDEAFMDYYDEEESFIKESIDRDNIIVLRSFTKFFALPGLRIGYMASNIGTIKSICQYKEPWTVNSLAGIAAEESLRDKDYITKSRLIVAKERNFLYNKFSAMTDIRIYPSDANFLLIELYNGIHSGELFYQMAKEGVLVRDCNNFYGLGDNYIRIAIKTHKENLLLLEILKRVIKKM